jgi:enterochelin esterase family protein
MKTILVFAGCVLTAAAQTATPPVRSPEIASDHRVTFRLRAPNANAVTMSGEFLKGEQALQKGADGVWSVTLGPIEPEIYHYNFTIDGVKTIDPSNPDLKTGSTPSTIMSVLTVPGSEPSFYDGRPVPHGTIRTHWYESKSLGTLRRLTVYTPPGYDGADRTRYPVLYLFHGANADETAWTRFGHVNLILDNLLAAGKIAPFVVAMPFGYGVPPGTTGGGAGSNVERFSQDLLGDVIPFIDSHYRTLGDRGHRAIAGLSMGGGESLGIGLNHLELFSVVGGFSAALRPAEFDQTFAKVKADPAGTNRQLKLLWVGCGTDDSLFAAAESFSKFLNGAGVKHTFHSSGGAHTWMVWRHYLSEFAPLAFPPPTHGASVRIVLVGDSTTAPLNGWGPGFCNLVSGNVTCLNVAKNGRSTSSYRAEGSWDAVLKELHSPAKFASTYVLIQFGHNDQPGKPGRSTDLATEFPANLHRYVREVKEAGAKPVLITPLTRRSFQNGVLKDSLGPWADATRKVAKEEGVPLLELNADSAAAVQKMGAAEANTLAMAPPPAEIQEAARAGSSPSIPKAPSTTEPNGDPTPVFDYTHLGPKGADFFGRIVAGELTQAVPELRAYLQI